MLIDRVHPLYQCLKVCDLMFHFFMKNVRNPSTFMLLDSLWIGLVKFICLFQLDFGKVSSYKYIISMEINCMEKDYISLPQKKIMVESFL